MHAGEEDHARPGWTTSRRGQDQWCIAKNEGGHTQTGVAKGLKVPCLFMIAEVSIRCQKNPEGWYTPYTPVYPSNTPLSAHVYYTSAVQLHNFDLFRTWRTSSFCTVRGNWQDFN